MRQSFPVKMFEIILENTCNFVAKNSCNESIVGQRFSEIITKTAPFFLQMLCPLPQLRVNALTFSFFLTSLPFFSNFQVRRKRS